MKVYCWSDLHTDYSANMQTVKETVENGDFSSDVLIVAGDVHHDIDVIKQTLTLLLSGFRYVTYVPGNHDLWLMQKDRKNGIGDSIAKFDAILRMCDYIGVYTKPFSPCERLWIVPLFSWYDETDASFQPIRIGYKERRSHLKNWVDYELCVWPSPIRSTSILSPSSPSCSEIVRKLELQTPQVLSRRRFRHSINGCIPFTVAEFFAYENIWRCAVSDFRALKDSGNERNPTALVITDLPGMMSRNSIRNSNSINTSNSSNNKSSSGTENDVENRYTTTKLKLVEGDDSSNVSADENLRNVDNSNFLKEERIDELRFNESNDVRNKVITFSHFLPRGELCYKEWLWRPALSLVFGSSGIDLQLRKAGSFIHVYGHSHMNYDMVFEGVRYIQNALGSPKESRMTTRRPLCIWPSS